MFAYIYFIWWNVLLIPFINTWQELGTWKILPIQDRGIEKIINGTVSYPNGLQTMVGFQRRRPNDMHGLANEERIFFGWNKFEIKAARSIIMTLTYPTTFFFLSWRKTPQSGGGWGGGGGWDPYFVMLKEFAAILSLFTPSPLFRLFTWGWPRTVYVPY